MDALKGLAEIVEHILYELLGLFVPGACFALSVAWVWGDAEWESALRFADQQPWIALGAAYLLGFVVQGISRPVTGSFEWVLQRPTRIPVWLYRRIRGDRTARRVSGKGRTGTLDRLASRQRHELQAPAAGNGIDLATVAEARWRETLGIDSDLRLSGTQVRDLSFSAISASRGRLDRFRAAASLTRGVATSVAVCTVLMIVQIATGRRSPNWEIVGWVELMVIAFYALMERSAMYHGLWDSVLVPQFLAHSSGPSPDRAMDSKRAD